MDNRTDVTTPRAVRPSLPVIARLAALCLAAAGCSDPGADAAGNAPDAGEDTVATGSAAGRPGPDTLDERPATLVDTLVVEGMPDPREMRLVESPPGFPLGFSTYVPADWRADEISSGEGDAVRLARNAGGTEDPVAAFVLFVYPAGASEADARALAEQVASSRGDQVEPLADPDPWALEALRFRETTGDPPGRITGWIEVGREGGRLFHVLVYHPAEYGDGMGPTVGALVRHWRWDASGRGLGGG